ncbi:hypothetical protein CMV_022579 [Castanea mollissima]|uniref:Uncharacterized protein n=1 Tax=Castanea mollissima TaxID=60419 RepID=A0A8J4VJJ8_9ROSI|nr:hypothetical protein CMV_022579 [Castanea mollissima]
MDSHRKFDAINTVIDKLLITIHAIDKVLLPKELFKAQAETPAPILTPKEAADSPKANAKKAPSLSDGANTPLADDEADQNSAIRFDSAKAWIVSVCGR